MLTQTPSSSAPSPVEDKSTRKGRGWRIVVTVLLTLSVLLMVGYSGVSFYIATQMQIGHSFANLRYACIFGIAV